MSLQTKVSEKENANQKVKRIHSNDLESLWRTIRDEVKLRADFEPIMSTFFYATVLNHNTFEGALSFLLASKIDSPVVSSMAIREIIEEAYQADPTIIFAAETDIKAVRERDPACKSFSTPFLFFKGFHAIQGHRIANWLWNNDRHSLAFYFQNQMSEKFGVDIHPAANIGQGIMFDHATGIVVGETTTIEDGVTMLHGVTLGGTGKDRGDRHPKIRKGVLIGASASIIGNIEIGEGAKVGAGSVVMENVPAQVTVAGVPAKIVGKLSGAYAAEEVDQKF
jgi:serine O-acetyltransferase